jgi:uncharacterized protein YjbJ (UPF0337 family)
MGELIDKAKGKVKETVGVATGDRELEGEGKVDTAKGNVKGAFEKAKQKVKEAVDPKHHPEKP